MHCHHDDLVLEDRDIRLMRAYLLWIDTVRKSSKYSSEWEPTDVDIAKSRLFWWIRSGNKPLPYPPPTAYSCPWYEVVTKEGNHDCFELHPHGEKLLIAQCFYDLIERKDEDNYIVGFGPYRFHAFRDPELEAERIQKLNSHLPEVKEDILKECREKQWRGWFLKRLKDLEKEQRNVLSNNGADG